MMNKKRYNEMLLKHKMEHDQHQKRVEEAAQLEEQMMKKLASTLQE